MLGSLWLGGSKGGLDVLRARLRVGSCALLSTLLAGCQANVRFDSGSQVSEVSVSGRLVDFGLGTPVVGATIRTLGIFPAIVTESDGEGEFRLERVPVQGLVILDVTAAGHVETISVPLLVTNVPIENLEVPVVSSQDDLTFRATFNVATVANRGTILGRVIDADAGSPLAGASGFDLYPDGVPSDAPRFLDANGDPSPGASVTSASGRFVYFNVSTSMTANVAVHGSMSGYEYAPAGTVVRSGAWSFVDLLAVPGETDDPDETSEPVSFRNDVLPIFVTSAPEGGGCGSCHVKEWSGCFSLLGGTVGGGSQSNWGGSDCYDHGPCGLKLRRSSDSIDDVYDDLVDLDEDYSCAQQVRINKENPAASLLLTKPLSASADHYGGGIFSSELDPRYQTIFRWISEGAEFN